LNARSSPVVVMGAGTVGCWIGGCLAAAGQDVVFIGRPRVLDALASQGLTLTDLDGRREHVAPQGLRLATEVPTGLAPRLVLFTVKSGATVPAAEQLGAAVPAATLVVSFQNGIGNTERARAAAPQLTGCPAWCPTTSPRSRRAASTAAPAARSRRRTTPPCAQRCPPSRRRGCG
jgi:2-dehydropantoate 2-reductase